MSEFLGCSFYVMTCSTPLMEYLFNRTLPLPTLLHQVICGFLFLAGRYWDEATYICENRALITILQLCPAWMPWDFGEFETPYFRKTSLCNPPRWLVQVRFMSALLGRDLNLFWLRNSHMWPLLSHLVCLRNAKCKRLLTNNQAGICFCGRKFGSFSSSNASMVQN